MHNTANTKNGNLFVVSTPIGHLKDITLRAIQILQAVEIVVCEDTRVSATLLNEYNIKKRLISFHKYSKKEKAERLIEYLKDGLNVALITDAGTPAISDPGAFLVKLALENNIKVVPIPGPSALTAAVSISGTCEKGFIFIGFMPSTRKQIEQIINKYFTVGLPVVFYESPKRLLTTFNLIKNSLEECRVLVFKELTKLHEDYVIGDIETVIDNLKSNPIKGEYTIIIEPSTLKEINNVYTYDKKLFLKMASEITGLTKREVYKRLFTKQ